MSVAKINESGRRGSTVAREPARDLHRLLIKAGCRLAACTPVASASLHQRREPRVGEFVEAWHLHDFAGSPTAQRAQRPAGEAHVVRSGRTALRPQGMHAARQLAAFMPAEVKIIQRQGQRADSLLSGRARARASRRWTSGSSKPVAAGVCEGLAIARQY